MKLYSWNVNGFRAVIQKPEWAAWFNNNNADIVALQETKAEPAQVPDEHRAPQGRHAFWSASTVKRGYSGVAVFAAAPPLSVHDELPGMHGEGRLLHLEYPAFHFCNVYFPNGQMNEEQLSTVMERMVTGETQILVCTTIIETGIDIPNVNTLIIEDADRMGLAQLHQLRGRVGRSNRRASAYLTFRRGRELSEIAEKRLSAIREFAEFNSGFRIAMRDLEIRGAGSLLGAEQSGHMIDVGYDMYLKLLEEAVLEERGEKPEQRAECAADLAVSANIPESYVPSQEQRMDLYRRIALVRTEAEADDLMDEVIDRFGDPPPSVYTLVQVALLRADAGKVGVTDISQKNGCLKFLLAQFDMQKVSALYARPEFKGRLKVDAGAKPGVILRLKTRTHVIEQARAFVSAWADAQGDRA